MGFADSEAARQTKKPTLEKVGEIVCENGLTYVISGYDSSMRVNTEDEFIRRYALCLKADPAMLKDFMAKTTTDKRNLQPDGTLMLLPPIPGSIDFFPQWLDTLAINLRKAGFELPVQAIEVAILRDMDHHPAQGHSGERTGR